jgi:hypothetical protein
MIEILYGGGPDVINESWRFLIERILSLPRGFTQLAGVDFIISPTTHKAPRVPYHFLFFLFLSLPPSRTDPSPSSFSFPLFSSFFLLLPEQQRNARQRVETERE